MTLKVTITHASPGYPMDAIVKQSNGNPDVRLSDGNTADFYIHSSNTLSVVEVPAAPVAQPQGGGGPGSVNPPV